MSRSRPGLEAKNGSWAAPFRGASGDEIAVGLIGINSANASLPRAELSRVGGPPRRPH